MSRPERALHPTPATAAEHMAAIMTATENMMTLFAMASSAGFEAALELLCEGARTNKGVIFGPPQ